MADHNRRREFGDIVTVEAWHNPFDVQVERVDLHVDVVFGGGRIGGEPEAPVRFRLALKQAEVVVIVPTGEPARVDIRSVRRDAPTIKAKATETRKTSRKASLGAGIGLGVSQKGAKASAKVDAKGSATTSRDEVVTIAKALQGMTFVQSQTPDNHYKWTITPAIGATLDGRPWDAAASPVLQLVDTRPDRSKSIPPSTRVEIRCRREDLLISDIVLKDEPGWEAMRKKVFHRNREATAEAIIRTKLLAEGLFCGDLSDPFTYMTLAVIVPDTL